MYCTLTSAGLVGIEFSRNIYVPTLLRSCFFRVGSFPLCKGLCLYYLGRCGVSQPRELLGEVMVTEVRMPGMPLALSLPPVWIQKERMPLSPFSLHDPSPHHLGNCPLQVYHRLSICLLPSG